MLANFEIQVSNVVSFVWEENFKFNITVGYTSQVIVYCEIKVSNITLLSDTSLGYCYLIVRYLSQVLLAQREIEISNISYCEIEISGVIVSYKCRILLAYCEIWISNIASLWWETNLKYCYLIVRYKSRMLLSYWEIEISDILLWATNLKYF
jgi:hypothetical protein